VVQVAKGYAAEQIVLARMPKERDIVQLRFGDSFVTGWCLPQTIFMYWLIYALSMITQAQ
jgi:hypothetical protein